MKPSSLLAPLLSAAVLACASLALAGTTVPPPPADPAPAAGPFYSGIKAGAFWLQDESYGFGAYDLDVDFDTGWGITVVPFGYQVADGFSISLNTGFYQAGVDGVELHGGGLDIHADISGDVSFVPIMANAVATIPLSGDLGAYIGAGAGIVYTSLDIGRVGGQRVDLADDSWDFGYQAFAGLSYKTCPASDLRVGYRFFQVSADRHDHRGHMVEAGISFRW